MKHGFVIMLMLFSSLMLMAEERLIFDYAGGFEVSSPYFLAEVDTVLNLYSYSETTGMMQILKRSYSPHSSTVASQVIWEQPVPPNLTTPLLWHKGERIYGKLWVYMFHTDWLGAISIDADGAAQIFQVNVPELDYNSYFFLNFQHFGEGHLYYKESQALKYWDLCSNEINTVVQMSPAYSLVRLGNEYMLISDMYTDQGSSYLIDIGHNLVQTNLQNRSFSDVYRFQDGLYWAKFQHYEMYGSCTLLIENGDVIMDIWNEYDIWVAWYSEYKPILRLPNSRFLIDYKHLNSTPPFDYHYFKIMQHNGGNNLGFYTGFPHINLESATQLLATYYQNKLLMMGRRSPGFFALLADLDTQTWIQVEFSTPITSLHSQVQVFNYDEHLWLLNPYNSGTTNLFIYHGAFYVGNDDPLIPAPADVTVWPNPARSQDVFKLKSEVPIKSVGLYNLRGQLLRDLSHLAQTPDEYTLPDLSPGIYLLRITDALRKVSHKKIMIRE